MPSATTLTHSRPKTPSRSLRRPSTHASTPNLKLAYSTHSRLAPPPLPRKASLAALTPGSLASIPDVTESYAVESVLSDQSQNMIPTTPGRGVAADHALGDVVDVAGGMSGTVRFVGSVQGKRGVFVGVELHPDFAARGKNSGDVDGVSYFSTNIPGAGIFLPAAKAIARRESIPAMPLTPTSSYGGLRPGNQNSLNHTPPTPGLPKFSASVGPGARAPSPGGKRAPRTSLPRPDSPVRRMQMTPGPRPSMATPAKHQPSRYGSPTNRAFAQSVRGTSGDPSKRMPKLDRKPSLGPRSASALGSVNGLEDEVGPMGGVQRTMTNGSHGSVSSFSAKIRPASRAASRTGSRAGNRANDEELQHLRAQLEDRERQLKDQSSTLTEMESSLVELQGLMESAEGLPPPRPSSMDNKDTQQLRQALREKNDKIAMLTSEFDAHRADFRSTIDTLELASSETERVYERRIEELMADVRELESRNVDVESVATQLKQLEELVQELEEGLEDARRGEAEARGEVEFLRGEVERTRTELRREREKATATTAGNAEPTVSAKELEQKDDEIRGLKAIIHSLSRDSVPGGEEVRTPTQRPGSFMAGDAVQTKIAHDNLERQVAELQALLDKKANREEELETELETFRQDSNMANHRSSLRDSRDTVVLAQAYEPRSPDATHKKASATHKRVSTLDTMPESDDFSNATESSTLWCEICETNGHDILTCTNMFGPDGAKTNGDLKTGQDSEELKPHTPTGNDAPAPLSTLKFKNPGPPSPNVKILPNPMESGPVAGKESGIMDPEKWCAVCERDGHDSVDCPFEDAF
ncbi:hypothetical protein B0T10DRAFT_601268 [Thelonectria olida]|uniref:CAP-Gly domain-containing protein n=1 Tax=Thelonectria olida TaxID=1576542 RepID=A0A9P9AY01_9HYPO|nr:hypothetical protein B0T10DRAFT_601268 [Thelonectria olida]